MHSMSESFTGGQGTGGTGSNDGEDIMSAFNEDPFGKKFESSVNLGDTTSTSFASSPAGTSDLSGLMNGLKGGSSSEIDKLLNSGYSLGLPSSDGSSSIFANGANGIGGKNVHHTGDTKEGIGTKIENVQGKFHAKKL